MEPNTITAWEATAVDGAELNSLKDETFERVKHPAVNSERKRLRSRMPA